MSKMTDKNKNQHDPNFTATSAEIFVEYYNKNIPQAFPQATISALEKFQSSHPDLFKRNGKWTIDRHRKKFMDWFASHKDEA